MTNEHRPASEQSDRRMPRWLKFGLIGVSALVVVAVGVFVWYVFIRDVEEAFDESDLAAALEVDGTTPDGTTPDATTPDAAAPDVTAPDATATAPAAGEAATGTWRVTEESELGYRVKEVLFGVDAEAVGRTNQVTGSLSIEGTAVTSVELVVDVASIESDDGRRDGQFRGRIMSTDEFPEATFVLTEPIELGTEPVEGAEVQATATGELTLRGVTNPVTFDLTARLENGRIGVLGSIPVVFADYDIANPSFGGITTEDAGLLEFVLVFAPA
jgi:polyisoprenoid-binding protein YceI